MLKITQLHASVEKTPILRGLDLNVNAGEVHAIMGPNGSGKSTLAQVLAGRETYQVTSGEVLYQGRDLLQLNPEERAREGVFLAFQYPVEIPGVSNVYLLKAALNNVRKHRGLAELDAMEFLKLIKQKMAQMDMGEELLYRSVNEGFSGGEKKRNEILQMALLEPKLAILDETDSGLDIDALQLVAKGINALRSPDRAMILVTHYQRLLDYVVPDFVHVLSHGRIVKTGGKELALELEERGYSWLEPVPVVKAKPVPPPPESSFIDELLNYPLALAGGALALLLAGYLLIRRRRANADGETPLDLSSSLSLQGSSLTANSVFRSTGGQSVDTSHAPAQTDFSQAGPGSIDTDEVDPVAEADVYMAYGRDAQAEEGKQIQTNATAAQRSTA